MNNFPRLEDFPGWLQLPNKYFELIQLSQNAFLPWYLINRDDYLTKRKGLQERYPSRELVPFAKHDYSDDVACWDRNKLSKVVIVHDYASPGYENRYIFESFDDWYNYVIEHKEDV